MMAPGPDSADARMDLKLLAHRTRKALAERWTAEAEARLAGLSSPDLWAGTVQDGTAVLRIVTIEIAARGRSKTVGTLTEGDRRQ